MIWQVMFGSGAMIGMMRLIMAEVRIIILKVLLLVNTVFCAAVRGPSSPGACGVRIATGARRRAGPGASGSVSVRLRSSNLLNI